MTVGAIGMAAVAYYLIVPEEKRDALPVEYCQAQLEDLLLGLLIEQFAERRSRRKGVMPMKVMPLRSVQPCLRFEVMCTCTEVQNEGCISVCCPQVA